MKSKFRVFILFALILQLQFICSRRNLSKWHLLLCNSWWISPKTPYPKLLIPLCFDLQEYQQDKYTCLSDLGEGPQKLFMATFISQIQLSALFLLSSFWSSSYALTTYQENCSAILILSLLVLLSGSAFIPPLSFPRFPHICLSHFITTSVWVTSVCLVLHSLSQAHNTLPQFCIPFFSHLVPHHALPPYLKYYSV